MDAKPLSAGAGWWSMTFRKMPSFSFANVLLLPWRNRSIIQVKKRHKVGRGH